MHFMQHIKADISNTFGRARLAEAAQTADNTDLQGVSLRPLLNEKLNYEPIHFWF